MEKKQAFYQCPICKRESCIVHLDKRCVFCEQIKEEEEKIYQMIEYRAKEIFCEIFGHKIHNMDINRLKVGEKSSYLCQRCKKLLTYNPSKLTK